jgi:hypothetical protein
VSCATPAAGRSEELPSPRPAERPGEQYWAITLYDLDTGKTWFTMFRFYGPDKPLFDKSWTMSDIEETH